MPNLTNTETDVLDALATAWNRFVGLPQCHPDEVPDFRKAIHDAQRIIMARPTFRAMEASGTEKAAS